MRMPSMPPIAASLLLAALLLNTPARAASDMDPVRKALDVAAREDNAAGAGTLLGLLSTAAGKAASTTNVLPRRGWEMLLNDIEDAITKLVSPEAQKVFAAQLLRLPPDAQISVCVALKNAPANAELDAAATNLVDAKRNFRLQVAAIDMLAAHKHQPALAKIRELLDMKAITSVQIACCRALASLPDKDSIPALIKYIGSMPNGGGGRYLYEAVGALRAITGEKFEPNADELKRWWEKNEKEYALDPSKAQPPSYNYELAEKTDTYYYEIPVIENRLVIVLDTSGSMMLGGKPNRLDRAKDELKLLISRMRDKQLFNIVAFSNNVRRWKMAPPLVQATEANKKEALAFIDTLKTGGGTQTTLTLEETLREVAVTYGCESIYLVTDGNPNPWTLEITNAQQERLATWINKTLKVRINTVGIYNKVDGDAKYGVKEDPETMREYLQKLAANNDGVYKEVGKDESKK